MLDREPPPIYSEPAGREDLSVESRLEVSQRLEFVDHIAVLCGGTVAAIGAIVLIGWSAEIEAFKSLIPGLIVMIPNTATAFMLAGIALCLQTVGIRSQGTRRFATLGAPILAAIVLLLGALTFIERMTGADLGIDLVLFAESVRRYPYAPPGRMASNSTVAFTLAGAALLTLRSSLPNGTRPARWFATGGLGIAGLALVGYLYDAKSLYRFDPAAGMALLTAISFFLLHLGILFAHPHEGNVSLLTGGDLAARIIRRLLPATIVLPLLFGWLWKAGRDRQLLSHEGGIALFAVIMVAALMTLVLTSARVIRDTDRERERSLALERDARAEADAANDVKSDFLATMSHELRTPLNAIIGYASLLDEGISGELTELQRTQVKRIIVSSRHLLTLIEQVLTLSRLEAGKVDLVPEPVDVASVVEEATTMVQPLIAQRGLSFRAHVASELPKIVTDASRLRQVLVNLLGNAVKFTDQGEMGITVRRESDTVCFDVWDTGIGIDHEHVDRIFEPFWQVDSKRTRRTDGTGLGLAVSRQLAHAMGGEIVVSTRPGEGSNFVLRLPIKSSGASSGDHPRYTPRTAFRAAIEQRSS